MGCANITMLSIKIHVITISKSAGLDLKKSITDGIQGQALLDVWSKKFYACLEETWYLSQRER